jgi:hypothetical protein
MDLAESGDRLAVLESALPEQTCLGISAVTGYGIPELRSALEKSLGTTEERP